MAVRRQRQQELPKNPLLVQDEVGRGKPTCFDLPPPNFTYGRPDQPDFEGAREVTMTWIQHQPSRRRTAAEGGHDFRKLNKLCCKEGIATSKAQRQVRQQPAMAMGMGDTQKDMSVPVGSPPQVFPSELVPSFAYGKKTRPSTPIAQVISCLFQHEHEALAESYADYAQQVKGQRRAQSKSRATRASEGHAFAAAQARERERQALEPREPFKLSKFKRVPARLHLPRRPCSVPPGLARLPRGAPAAAAAPEVADEPEMALSGEE